MASFRVEIRVMPRGGILDPQGQAVAHALHALGFADVNGARVGKHLVLTVDAANSGAAEQQAKAMCDRLLANPVTEDYLVAVEPA
ncbi:MAG TPA: phosphoribosylformylglycinamidine synthase subunit PurS [Gemmatimonadales bacterium]|nr:phosphoribosylformylglycinamidine synthase subunit PurS [Gemmatimonadales bacterium]